MSSAGTMADVFEAVGLDEAAPVRRRIFKDHSMARKMAYRCPTGYRRAPGTKPGKRPRCVKAQRAVGGAGRLVRIKRKAHMHDMSGRGKKEERLRARWAKIREPLLRREAITMGAVFALLEAKRERFSNAPLTDREERDLSRANVWAMDVEMDDGHPPREVAHLMDLRRQMTPAEAREMIRWFLATAPGNF